jgi:hypothetical protein
MATGLTASVEAGGLLDSFPPSVPAANVVISTAGNGYGSGYGSGYGVTPELAMRIPAFGAGVRLISEIAASFPLTVDGERPRALAGSLHPSLTDHALIALLIRRLILNGRAHATEITDSSGTWIIPINPAVMEPLPGEVWEDTPRGWRPLGERIPGRLLTIDTGSAGVLSRGAQALTAAWRLEQTAARISRSPIPSTILQSSEMDLTTEQAEQLVTDWESRREDFSTAYLGRGLRADFPARSAADLQLVESRKLATIQCAQILGLDPIWLGVAAEGSSLTYQNRQDLNLALLDNTVQPLISAVEQSLSRFWSRRVRFDVTGFTRSGLAERVQALTAYVAAGIMTTSEARGVEPIIPEGESLS